MDTDRYLARLGLSRADVTPPDIGGLRALQRAHVRTVPFETLAITGDPFDDGDDGEGVSLALADLYQKIVERERGGFCFELNGLFGWLLTELGFESDRVAARVLDDDGRARPPANHHAHVVSLDRRYVVDVGLGVPPIRRPLALDGTPLTDGAGVTWRVVGSDRPDADYLTQFRRQGDDWTDRYVFRDRPRDLAFFRATCEYLATAPESSFTGEPVISRATADGHRKLTAETITIHEGSETRTRGVDPEEWHALLEREFGLRYDPPRRGPG